MEENPFQKYERITKELSRRAFESHAIKEIGDRRWVISRQDKDGFWESPYLTEIIVGIGKTLIVHGDIDAVIFGYYRSNSGPLQVVNWVSSSSIHGYLESKARIGMTAQSAELMTKQFDFDVAIWDMQSYIEDCRTEQRSDISDGSQNKKILAWQEAIRSVRHGQTWELVRMQLYNDLLDAGEMDAGELMQDLGLVPAPRLYYAQEACRKLLELLSDSTTEEFSSKRKRVNQCAKQLEEYRLELNSKLESIMEMAETLRFEREACANNLDEENTLPPTPINGFEGNERKESPTRKARFDLLEKQLKEYQRDLNSKAAAVFNRTGKEEEK